MSDGVACPACQKPLPESVVKGPAQAVVRCEQCATLLLWSHGKVVRSARSSNPSTLQGMPVQKPPSPVAPPRPAAPKATLMGIPTPPPRPEPPKAAPPPKPQPEKTPPEKPQIAAAIAQPAKAMPGPMENPTAWFDDAAALTEEDDEPTKVGAEPEPLPPLEPAKPELPVQKTVMGAAPPQQKTVMAPAPAQPKTVMAPAPAQPKTAPPQPKTVMAPAQPKTVMAPAPAQQKTVSAPAPLFAKAEPPKVEPPKIEPPKVEAPKIELPRIEPPREEPRAAIPTPTPLGGVMEPVLDLSTDKRRPPIVYAAVAAGGALVLVLVMVLAFRGSGKPPVKTTEPPPKPAVAVVEKAPEPPPKPAVAVAEKAPEPPPVVAPPVVEKRVAKAEPSYESAVAEPAPRHRSHTLGGKKVVLEDDKSAPVEPKEDPAQVERARDAYKRGNEKLFAGNSAGAIEAYKESLSIYPGYVAGYRGLGLAYAQEGNNADALKALKTYVKNAPNAHDVPLIMKRIERLEKSPQD